MKAAAVTVSLRKSFKGIAFLMLLNALMRGRRNQWFALVLVWTFFAAAGTATLLYLRHEIVLTEQDRLAEQAIVLQINIRRQLEAVNAGLVTVVRDLAIFGTTSPSDYSEMLRKELQLLSETMVGIRTLLVLDSAGNALISNRAELIGRNFAEREYFQTAMSAPRSDSLYLSEPFRTVLDVYSMTLSRISVTQENQVNYIVNATLDPEFFQELLNSVRYTDDLSIALFHGSGRLAMILPLNPEMLGEGFDKPGSLFRRHKDSGTVATIFEGSLTPGNGSVWVAQRTIDVEALNMSSSMVVAVTRDPAKVLKGWQSVALVSLIVWLSSAVAAGAVLSLYQRHQTRVRVLLAEKEALRQQVEAELHQFAFYDPLTKLPNRRLLIDRLQQLQAASLRHGRCSALLFIDLDGFKQVNDTYGHEIGDKLLKEAAVRLSSSVREEDTVSRLGGDEFVIMLSELSANFQEALELAQTLAGKLLRSLSEDYVLGVVRCHCSASIGITLFGHQQENESDILKRADHAMYEAKQSGRNAVRLAKSQQMF